MSDVSLSPFHFYIEKFMGPKLKSAEEEKKSKLYQHMYNTGTIYNNSTIEHAAKPTGISAMIIKNIV